MEGLFDAISPVKELIESKINLSRTADKEKRICLNQNKVMRICFIAGLGLPVKRTVDDYKDIQLSLSSSRIVPSFFTMHDLSTLYSALLKLRYADLDIDWSQNATLSRIIAAECFVDVTIYWQTIILIHSCLLWVARLPWQRIFQY